VAPQVKFLWHRLTPGQLGLELTTALALTGAGAYVFAFYASVVGAREGPTALDREVLELANDLRESLLVDVMKVVTDLGAAPTVATATVIAVAVLAVRRRPYELATLVVASVLLYLSVQMAKAGIDRPRPPAPLVETAKASFPSGHTAYSTAWVALAVALSRVVPGLASAAGLISAGIVVTALVGLSRVYLRAHYWSDVVGGWGLGFAVFGLCATVALIVAFVRQNAVRAEASPARSSPR
jgi:undecaprenyl-diphosphatase